MIMMMICYLAKGSNMCEQQDEDRYTTEYLSRNYEEKKGELALVGSGKTVYPIKLTKEEKARALPIYGTSTAFFSKCSTLMRRNRTKLGAAETCIHQLSKRQTSIVCICLFNSSSVVH